VRSIVLGVVHASLLSACLAEGSTASGDAGLVGPSGLPDAARVDASDGSFNLGDAVIAPEDAHGKGPHDSAAPKDAKSAMESGSIDAPEVAPPGDATVAQADAGAPPPDAPAPCGGIAASTILEAGHSAVSCDGRFSLVMQSTDGNLVLYFAGAALWNANTAGNPGAYAAMQSDGNFVVYDSSSVALWQAGTAGNPGADLAVQDDGNVVVYSTTSAPLWDSGTCCH
jgi:hypothetical protein